MKRWIHASSLQDYINSLPEVYGYKILFEDEITIQLEAPDINDLIASKQYDPFPGETQYVQDLKDILQNEFGFVIVPDTKGRMEDISSTNDGLSVYFNTVYNLSNIEKASTKYKFVNKLNGLKVGVLCAIEIRISDHNLTADRDSNGNKETEDEYALRQTLLTKNNNPNIAYIFDKQAKVVVNQSDLYSMYSFTLDTVRSEVAQCIRRWMDEIVKQRNKGAMSGIISVL